MAPAIIKDEEQERTCAVDVLLELLSREPGLNKREIVARLRGRGLRDLTAREVNLTLYRNSTLFYWEPGTGTSRLWATRRPHVVDGEAVNLTRRGRWRSAPLNRKAT